MHEFFLISFALFLLMDSLGNVPIFMSLLKDFPPKQRTRIILRELCIALVTICLFYFLGDFVLGLMQIQQYTLFISGGLVLLFISIRMIFPPTHTQNELKPLKDPVIVPMAIPMIAGPAVLAAVMIYSQQKKDPFLVIGSLIFAWICSSVVLLSSNFLQRLVGEKGLAALERLMGLLLTLIAIQMFLQGICIFVHKLAVFPSS